MSHATAQTSRLTTLSLQGCQHTLLRQYRRPGPRHSRQCARAAAPLRHQRVCSSIGSSQVKIEPFPFVFLLKLPISPNDCPPLPSRPLSHSIVAWIVFLLIIGEIRELDSEVMHLPSRVHIYLLCRLAATYFSQPPPPHPPPPSPLPILLSRDHVFPLQFFPASTLILMRPAYRRSAFRRR